MATTDYQLLLQKFHNFKKYMKDNGKDKKCIEDYSKMTENAFLLFGIGFLLPNKNNLNMVANKMCEKVKIEDKEVEEKIKRYLQCFVEYLDQLNSPELTRQVILNNAEEKGINITKQNNA